MECCEAHHKYELAIVYGKEILRHDQARERTHRRLMRLYYLKGDRTGALRQFMQCRDTLKDELDVEPSQRTISLLKRIENDKYDDSSLGALSSDGGMQTSQGQIADSLKLVSKLLRDQSSNQEQISEEFDKLERALRNLL
jgi:DNA-binding SARP family transcriptional activator